MALASRFFAALALLLASTPWVPFMAGEAAATPFTFAATADMGVNPTAAANVARMAEANPAFVLHAGDLAYSGGDPAVWDAFMQQIQLLTSRGPYMPAVGNHDYEGGLALYTGRFDLPNNERWYSFNHSNVHVISLDGGPSYDALPVGETAWLEADLENNSHDADHPWTVVELHYPLFSTGLHGSWGSGRALWGTLFDRYGVELVIQGHDHDYERSWPVDASGQVAQGDYDRPRAPVYVTTGGGGAGLYPLGLPAPWSAFRAAAYETLRISVDANRMTVEAIAPDGGALDSFTLTLVDAAQFPSGAVWVLLPLAAAAATGVTLWWWRGRRGGPTLGRRPPRRAPPPEGP